MGESFYGNVINKPKGLGELTITYLETEENGETEKQESYDGDLNLVIDLPLGFKPPEGINDSPTIYHKPANYGADVEGVYCTKENSINVNPGQDITISSTRIEDIDFCGHLQDYAIKDYNFTLIGGKGTKENGEIFNDYVNNQASGEYSHAEGYKTTASGQSSHTEGMETQAISDYSHAEGQETQATGIAAHSEGYLTQAEGDYTHVEGEQSLASGKSAHSEGQYTQALGEGSHAEGLNTQAENIGSHAEGKYTIARGLYAHAEGVYTLADGEGSHAEGRGKVDETTGEVLILRTQAIGPGAHAEGLRTKAWGNGTHAEGFASKAEGYYAHAEGQETIASGVFSHSQGNNTEASGEGSFASGLKAKAKGNYSFAQGNRVIANSDYSVALGQYNYTEDPNRIFQIGWGSNEDNRKDIMYLTKNGGLYAEEFYNSNGETLTSIRGDLDTTKKNLKFKYEYDEVKQELKFYQGEDFIGTVNVPINAVVNSARVLEGTTQLELTVNVENESGEIYPKSLIIDFGKVALDQMLLGDTNTIELFQNIEDGLQKICGNIKLRSLKGGDSGHLSTTPGSRIQEVNLDDNIIKTRCIADSAITNSKLSIINPETREGAAVNTNNLFDKAITSEKIEDFAITTNKIIDEAITSEKIADEAITLEKIANNSVKTESIVNGAITEEKLGTTVIKNINGKLDIKDSVGTGTFSFNRLANSTVGLYSTTFGNENTASGNRSFAIGYQTQALGLQSFVSGSGGIAQGQDTHVEGRNGLAIGTASHVEGIGCSTGDSSPGAHAEGNSTQANASYAHAEGFKTIATKPGQHVEGMLNIVDEKNLYLHIVGNGQQEYVKDGVLIRPEVRSNAHTLDYAGNAWFAGSVDCTKLYLRSSTPGSTKRFQITINDNGDLSIKEV